MKEPKKYPSTFDVKRKRWAFNLWSQQKRTEKVSSICQRWLNEMGIELSREIYQVVTRSRQHVYLVRLHMQDRRAFPAADLLAIRLFLTLKVEEELCLESRSIRIFLQANVEAKSIKMDPKSITSLWLHNRISGHFSKRSKKAPSAGPLFGNIIEDLKELDQLISYEEPIDWMYAQPAPAELISNMTPVQERGHNSVIAEPDQLQPDSVLPVGVWVELKVNQIWIRTQLSWINPDEKMYLFTSACGRTQSMTRRMRDKLISNGLIRLISC
ncbi:MAG: hypothetical protein Q8K22_11075 [Rhodoferax sp.]|nr:hypothetical protein [Rhodoferax sp.]